VRAVGVLDAVDADVHLDQASLAGAVGVGVALVDALPLEASLGHAAVGGVETLDADVQLEVAEEPTFAVPVVQALDALVRGAVARALGALRVAEALHALVRLEVADPFRAVAVDEALHAHAVTRVADRPLGAVSHEAAPRLTGVVARGEWDPR